MIAPRGIGAQAKLEAWLAVQRCAELENDHATRLAALERLEALAESTGNGALAVDVLLARALTHQRAGAAEASLATYARAVAGARTPQPDEQRLVAETVELAIAEMRRRLA